MSGHYGRILFVVAMFVAAVAVGASHAAAESLKSLKQLKVFDATGKKVGDVLSMKEYSAGYPNGSSPIVALKFGGHVFTVEVLRHQLSGNLSDLLYFQSQDCTGTPYLRGYLGAPALFGDQADVLLAAHVSAPGKTVYLPVPGSISQSRSVQSSWWRDGVCQLGGDAGLLSVPAFPLIDLNTVFTPPFSVR